MTLMQVDGHVRGGCVGDHISNIFPKTFGIISGVSKQRSRGSGFKFQTDQGIHGHHPTQFPENLNNPKFSGVFRVFRSFLDSFPGFPGWRGGGGQKSTRVSGFKFQPLVLGFKFQSNFLGFIFQNGLDSGFKFQIYGIQYICQIYKDIQCSISLLQNFIMDMSFAKGESRKSSTVARSPNLQWSTLFFTFTVMQTKRVHFSWNDFITSIMPNYVWVHQHNLLFLIINK